MAFPNHHYYCLQACGKSFGSQRGLTKHQDRCIIYNDITGAELFESVELQESATKKPRLGEYSGDLLNEIMNTGMDSAQNSEQLTHRHASDSEMGNFEDSTHYPNSTSSGVDDQLGRGKRKKWKTKRYIDPRPEPPAPLPEPELPTDPTCQPATATISPEPCTTAQNANGLFRVYVSRPTYVPDEWPVDYESTQDIAQTFQGHDAVGSAASAFGDRGNADTDAPTTQTPQSSNQPPRWFAPFLNPTSFRLMNWFWGTSSNKSLADLQSLADSVLKAQDFNIDDLEDFSVRKENNKLDDWANDVRGTELLDTRDGWIRSSVEILLPTGTRHSSLSTVPRFTIPGLHYRSITEVIKAAFQSESALRFHYTPYKQYWQRDRYEAPVRVYDEMYAGDAWLVAHEEVQRLPRAPDDCYERVIAGLMLWQDSTHLTSFGNASLWPLYVYFGNQPKYERSKPSLHACHHLAYLPKLPDNVSDAFKKINGGKLPTSETLTHCKRDLMHALLATIFNESFRISCTEGLMIQCFDGVKRRVFPRIMTYSADYPEKTLLASIKFLSAHPCPRCLIKKPEAHRLGSPYNESVVKTQPRMDSYPQQVDIERTRSFIYKEGRGVKSAAVEAVLSPKSLVPTSNALSKIMFLLGYNFYRVFVVDFLHEIELGLWKLVLIHLIRILAVCSPEAILLLNERYRLISTFGGDTIRKFTNDASSLRKLAARDYEDLLLCSMPVFDGLFPEPHDTIVRRLLFSFLTWHALAKLRVHTEITLSQLEKAKHQLSSALQRFQDITCQAYETRELPAERLRRERREARNLARRAANGPMETSLPMLQTEPIAEQQNQQADKQKRPDKTKGNDAKGNDTKGSRRKRFNLNTYKGHAPEHYVQDIREFGTVDSYSTQIGELEHRTVKRYYSRTNKNLPVEQITKMERREYTLRHISAKDPTKKGVKKSVNSSAGTGVRRCSTHPTVVSSCTLARSCEEHHHISKSRNESIYLNTWLRSHIYDPATQGFQRKLKDHLLERFLNISWDDDPDREFTETDRNTISIEYNRLYVHKVFRVNYTTYDGQRKQDSMNPRTRSDVMVLAHENTDCAVHPYLYARIIGVFHAMVKHTGRRSTTEGVPLKMEILWVRWFKRASIPSDELPSKSLTLLTFVSDTDLDANAFGFLDPQQVVRGIHLIPAFRYGKTRDLLCHSIARKPSDDDEDWVYYHVNKFVDRDMYMRYNGGGIGHSLLQLKTVTSTAETSEFEDVGSFSLPVDDYTDEQTNQSNEQSQERVVFDPNSDEVISLRSDGDRESDNSDSTITSDEEGEDEEED